MRHLAWLMTILKGTLLAIALGVGLPPLVGIPTIPDGSDVKVVSLDAAVYATGVVKARVLTIITPTAAKRLPAAERVQLWIGIPSAADLSNRELKSIPAVTSATGTDLLIGEGKDRASLTQVLREAYGIRLEMR
jgi:hypothetical protein